MTGVLRLPTWDSLDESRFLQRVRPSDWSNPLPRSPYDLLIIGAGPAGLEAADEAVRLGASVALVERNRLGGNSLNVGSIPSKSIIRASRLRAAVRDAEEFSATTTEAMRMDYGVVLARMHRIRARIAEYHSAERLREKGIDLYFGQAHFSSPTLLRVGDVSLAFRKALIATGARPRKADIKGIDNIDYRTSTTIFDMDQLPKRMVVIGGGPLGCELAQAFCKLGSDVSIVEANPKFLPLEERDAAEVLSRSMARDGVTIRLNTTVTAARTENGIKVLETVNAGVKDRIETGEILLSVGRAPNVETLALEMAGIAFTTGNGIGVDSNFRTSNPNTYAAGDVCSPLKFVNVARASARVAVRHALLDEAATTQTALAPWCTYCDPEIAHIGLHIWDARAQNIPVTTYTVMMQDIDRAITDGEDTGFIKIHLQHGTDRILGASIVATNASEIINEMAVIMSAGIGMNQLSSMLHTYPSRSEGFALAALTFVRDARLREPTV
jgi:pyruvate/2-oxoglutarate dehydrogenase complex dihydrolipoamide dehydrogenase (E3) component